MKYLLCIHCFFSICAICFLMTGCMNAFFLHLRRLWTVCPCFESRREQCKMTTSDTILPEFVTYHSIRIFFLKILKVPKKAPKLSKLTFPHFLINDNLIRKKKIEFVYWNWTCNTYYPEMICYMLVGFMFFLSCSKRTLYVDKDFFFWRVSLQGHLFLLSTCLLV